MSRPYAEVIGDPISQSKSPIIHTFWLERCGIPADYRTCHVTTQGLAKYLEDRRGDPAWRGCNVTMPHKLSVIPLLDGLEPLAERIGAVNTIVRDSAGRLVGHNTDAPGFLSPLRPWLDQVHLFRMARIIGTGGAARAIVAALAKEKLIMVLIGRDPHKARAMLDELAPGGEHHAAALEDFAEPTEFAFDDRAGCLDLVINASLLGMIGQPPLRLDFSHVPPGSVVYDIVTAPPETPLLAQARQRGLPTVPGIEMLIGQAAQAFALFFRQPPPRDGDAVLRARLGASF